MRKLDIIIGWLLIAFGVAHISFTRSVHPNLGINAIWFASGGLFMITIGALNLLRGAYSSVAKGVYRVSVVANLVLLVLMLFMATRLSMRNNPQVLVGLVLATLLTVFSVLRRADHVQSRRVQSANSSGAKY